MSRARIAAKSLFTVADRILAPLTGPRLLIYHQIGAGHGREMDVHPGDFSAHLDWIRGVGGQIVPLDVALSNGSNVDSEDIFVLTFDDGYEDMYENAFPVLRERGLPFTLYLTTGPTENGTPLAPDRRSTPLTWAQVNEMNTTGLLTLGAHTHSHPDLRYVDEVTIADELGTSDELIERRTGVIPRHFAYPWGYASGVAEIMIRERYATTSLGGAWRTSVTIDPHRLHRIPIQLSDGKRYFSHKARRGQRTEEFVRRVKAGYRGP